MTYLDVLSKHGYTLHHENILFLNYEKISGEIEHRVRMDADRGPLSVYAIKEIDGDFNITFYYSTGDIEPTPEQLDVIITVLTAE